MATFETKWNLHFFLLAVPVLDPVINFVAVKIRRKQDHRGDHGKKRHRVVFLIAEFSALDC